MANNDLVGSLLKALDILKVVGDGDRGMRLAEIADALGLKRPAVHNLVRTMIARGFLEKRNNHRLYIGPTLLEIADRQQSGGLLMAAEREMRLLADTLPEGVIVFGVAAAREMKQLLRISSERPGVLQRLHGDLFHPYASAAGLIGLAFASESVRLGVEEHHPFAEHGAHLWKDREALETFLETVRNKKVAVSPFDRELFTRVSAPVFDRRKRLTAVLGASIPTGKVGGMWPLAEIIGAVRKAAERLGKE